MRGIVAALRFIRFPLVWTALADSAAGAAIAVTGPDDFSITDVLPLLLITPGLYLFGMALNDLLDIDEDQRHNRDRPIARGELSFAAALAITVFLLGITLIGASMVTQAAQTMIAVTLGCIAIYNAIAKRWIVTAVPMMSACRMANILVGWSVLTPTESWRFYRYVQDDPGHVLHAWALLLAVGLLTAVASIASGLEKHRGFTEIFGAKPTSIVLGSLLLLPLADGIVVAEAWQSSLWSGAWLLAIPLVMLSAAALRRLRALLPATPAA